MSLLDSEIKEIIGNEPKHNWKDYIHGITPNYTLENERGQHLGRFLKSDKIKNQYDLYDKDDSIFLSITDTGNIIEIKDSKGVFLGKIKTKRGFVKGDTYLLNNSKDEIIIQGIPKTWKNNLFEIQDNNENIIAEWKLNRNSWILYLHDGAMDRIFVLGFIFGIITHWYYHPGTTGWGGP